MENNNVNHRFDVNESQAVQNKMNSSVEEDSPEVKMSSKMDSPDRSEEYKSKTCNDVIKLVETLKMKDPSVLEHVMELFKNLIIDNESSHTHVSKFDVSYQIIEFSV